MTTPKSKRLRGVTIERPFVYGSVSQHLSKTDDSHLFKWTVYVRGVDNEDLSPFIKRVTFHLHESFESPVRHIDTPPFQVEEKGWGEFTIGMSISFHDASLKPVDVHHFLKLFPDQNSPQYALPVENRRPVVLEKYDELLFVDPTEDFNAALTAPLRALPANPLSQFWSTKDRWAEEERRQLAQLSQVHDTVLRQIAKAKHDMRDLETENASFREQLTVVSAIKATKK